MKNAILFACLLCALLFTQSCKYSKEYQTVKAGNDFSLSIPPWLEETDKLKEGAQLQYSSRYRNVYVIGEVLPSSTPAPQVVAENISRLKKSMLNGLVSDSVGVTLSGLSGSRVEVYGKMNDENIYFSEVLLQGQGKYYHISIWTRGEDRKLRYKADINKILASFKVL